MHYCLLAVLMLLLPLSAFAKDSDYEKAMARGQGLLELQDYRGASREFRSALAERADDPSASFALGASLNRGHDPEAESALKQALRLNPANPEVTLELGSHYLAWGVTAEARDYFEETLRLSPDSEAGRLARRGLELLRKSKTGKNWGISFLSGMQYDSNVTLSPEGLKLSAINEPKEDWRGVINLGLSWTPLKTGPLEVTGAYSFYQSLHTRLDRFDLTQNQVGLTSKYTLSPMTQLALGYSFEHLMLGGDDYAVNHNVTPSVTLTFHDGWLTTLAYRYRNANYKNGPYYAFNSERSGDNHQLGITQKTAVSDNIAVRLSYNFELDVTEKNYWDSKAHLLSGGVTARLPWDVIADLSAGAAFRRYDSPAAAGGISRDDSIWTTSALLSRQFSSVFSLTAGWYLTRNQSNIASYDYSRNITSLLGQVRF